MNISSLHLQSTGCGVVRSCVAQLCAAAVIDANPDPNKFKTASDALWMQCGLIYSPEQIEADCPTIVQCVHLFSCSNNSYGVVTVDASTVVKF